MPKTLILIPSRLSATRLPGKPLLKINGISIISHVVKKAQKSKIGETYVATEDIEILEDVEKNGGKVIGHTEKDDSFDFETSKALKNENTFWGLCLDEDNQDELTEERLENWFNKLKKEINVRI